MPYRNDDSDEIHPAEFPEGEADDAGIECPECGASIHAESEQCPRCGHYLTEETPPRKPWWVLIGLALALALAVAWAVRVGW